MKRIIIINATVEVEQQGPGGAAVATPVFFYDPEGGISMGSITVPDDHAPIPAHVGYLDSEGQATTVESSSWSASDESVVTVTPSDDGLSAEIAFGSPGVSTVDVVGTNADGSTVQAQGTVTVQPGNAVIGEVTFDLPEAPTP